MVAKSFLKKVYVFFCVKCKETFESSEGSHRQQCPACGSLCSVKESHLETNEEEN